MAKLILFTDLSPSAPWLAFLLHSNLATLARQDLALAPVQPRSVAGMKDHNHCWQVIRDGSAIPAVVRRRLDRLAERLDSGQNLILQGFSPNLVAHQSLTRLLQDDSRFARHQVRQVLVIGRPACVMEQRYRRVFAALAKKISFALVRNYSSLAETVDYLAAEWGRENLTLLPDLSETPTATMDMALANSFFAALGCGDPVLPGTIPPCQLFLHSWEARRLTLVPEVRQNAWPEIDMGAYMGCLARVDDNWPEGIICPKKYRQILLRESRDDTSRLEDMLGLASGSLACPEWLAEATEATHDLPLPLEKAREFISELPPATAKALNDRYANDAGLLTRDQQAIQTSLAEAGDLAHIGEAEAQPVMTVLTMTYNHERYIKDCLDSVLAQKTDFPIRHLVLDHHSTDATARIVSEYAERYKSIRPVLLSERSAEENIRGLFLRCQSKYAALCDGDDYFTDETKLQRQFEFLENEQDCSLCFHPVKVIHECGESKTRVFPDEARLPGGFRTKYDLADLILTGNFIQTNSVVYRWRFASGLPDWFRADLLPSDWYWHVIHAENGKIGFINRTMSVYRRHENAAFYKTDENIELEQRRTNGLNELKMYQAFRDHFPERFRNEIDSLANGVFVRFLQIKLEENDPEFLETATRSYPEFADFFLRSIKSINELNGQRQATDGKGNK